MGLLPVHLIWGSMDVCCCHPLAGSMFPNPSVFRRRCKFLGIQGSSWFGFTFFPYPTQPPSSSTYKAPRPSWSALYLKTPRSCSNRESIFPSFRGSPFHSIRSLFPCLQGLCFFHGLLPSSSLISLSLYSVPWMKSSEISRTKYNNPKLLFGARMSP